MIQRIHDRLFREDKGFTLIELMVVVLIIAILIAIAIPTFLGARKRAQDRAAQSTLRNTVTAAKTLFTDKEDYASATQGALTSTEPSITFVATGTTSTDPTTASVNGGSSPSTVFYAATFSKAGNCWFVRDTAGPGSTTIGGTYWNRVNSVAGAGCSASAAPADSDSNWHRNIGDVT